MEKMTLAKKQKVIKGVLNKIKKHRNTIGKFFAGVSEPLEIEAEKTTQKNLWKIMLLDIQSRGGPKLNDTYIRTIKKKFERDVDLRKAAQMENAEKFQYLYQKIVGLPRIGPKITAVFMKGMISKFQVFPELKNYLFLPVDLHVANILEKRLKLFRKEEICKGNPFKSPKSLVFQNQLSEIHRPRIELDDFWFIGYIFCNKKSGLVCNEFCWIRKYCKDKFKV